MSHNRMDRRNKPGETDYQNVIKAAKVILVKNIVPCKELYDTLREHHVFPESMLDDIRACPTNEDKNSKLVDLLLVRGRQVALPFADALQLSGHGFLSDFLRDELDLADDGKPSQIDVDKKHLSKKIPRLDMILPDKDKEELISYMRNRIKEEVISDKWSKIRDTEKVLNAKQAQLEQSSRHKDILREKEERIKAQQQTLDETAMDLKNKGLQIKHLSNYIEELERKHKKDLEAQMQYNAANDKSLQRLTERDHVSEEKLLNMIRDMAKCIENNEHKQDPNPGESNNEGEELEKYQLQHNPLDKARATLNKLFDIVRHLGQIRDRCYHLEDERNYVMSQLGQTSENDSLNEAFRKFLTENEQKMEKLRDEIRHLENVMKEKADSESDSTSGYKKQVEKLTTDVAMKSDQIKKLNEENKKLTTRVNYLKSLLNDKESNESSKAINKPPVIMSTPFENSKSSTAAEGLVMHKQNTTPVKLQRPKDAKSPRPVHNKQSASTTQTVPVTTAFERGTVTLTISSMMGAHGGYKQALDASVPGTTNGLPPVNRAGTISPTKNATFQFKK